MTTETQHNSHAPKAVGFALGFLTLGVGIVKSVGPFELIVRAIIMAIVAAICTKVMTSVWYASTDEGLEAEGNR